QRVGRAGPAQRDQQAEALPGQPERGEPFGGARLQQRGNPLGPPENADRPGVEVGALRPPLRHEQFDRVGLTHCASVPCVRSTLKLRYSTLRIIARIVAIDLGVKAEQDVVMSTVSDSTVTFTSAEHEYRAAWSNPAHTRFELPAVNV